MQRRLRKLTLDVPSAGLAPSGLEKFINAAAGFADPAKFRHELAKAEMRTARVEIGGKPKGTGFLIGNSLLLRAWHVVERYDDNGGIAIFDNKVSVPGKDERQAARTVAFATEWLVARSCSLSVREAGGTPLARRTGPSGQGTNSVTEARMASNHTPERCLEAAFRFLLDREPKESILGRFDVTVISRYFPEFERELPHYLSRS